MNDKASDSPSNIDYLKKLQEVAAEWGKRQPQAWPPPNGAYGTCPSCGYCPHCGRGGAYRTVPYVTWTAQLT